MQEILLRANCIEGIVAEDITDYPQAEILSFADFRDSLKDCGTSDIFTFVMPKGTDGHYELLDAEYYIDRNRR